MARKEEKEVTRTVHGIAETVREYFIFAWLGLQLWELVWKDRVGEVRFFTVEIDFIFSLA
jgi:hypothetical protein